MEFVDIGLYVAYGLFIIGVIAAIVLPLIYALGDPKQLIKGGIGIIGVLVIFFICYTVSSNEVTAVYTRFGVGSGLSKIIGAGLLTMYAFFILAFLSIVFTEIAKNFK